MITQGQDPDESIVLAVILPSLAGGGIERMRIHLIREWVKQGMEVELVVSRFEGPLCGEMPAGVRIVEVARLHPLLFPFGIWRYFKVRRPSHVLSAANDINVMTLAFVRLLGRHSRTVVSIHNHLSSELAVAQGIKGLKLRLVTWLLKRVIPNANGVIAVSNGVAEDLVKLCPIPESRLHVVYNPVITEETWGRVQQPLANCPVPKGLPWIVFVGRLVQAKGPDILIDAFASIHKLTTAHLVLVGDGPLRSELLKMVTQLGLGQRVHFVGFQLNPFPWMREANVLVLPSRHEGLGNVLIEAMACGTQVIAADCPSGPAEILVDGRLGQLVPVGDVERLARAMLEAVEGRFSIAPELLKGRAESFSSESSAAGYSRVLLGQ